jgi:hypothetical protein
LFADNIRLIPGAQYQLEDNPRSDVSVQLQRLAEAAHERNVRIYTVKEGLPVPRPPPPPGLHTAVVQDRANIDNALNLLATETGGRYFRNSNRVDEVFDWVDEDLACFYRLGFRLRPRYTGKVEPIRIRIVGRAGSFRLRHRLTLEDPTREQLDTDIVRAAFLAPPASDDFPITLTAFELFRHDGGARIRLQVGTSLGNLLGLPAPAGRPGALQVRVQIGGRVVPLRSAGKSPGSRRPGAGGLWAEVATDRDSYGFGRRATLTVPPGTTAGGPPEKSIVAVEEFDAPPGRYRIVAVIQDQLARTIAAATTDLQVSSVEGRLGPLVLVVADPQRVVIEGSPGSDGDGAPASWSGKELAGAVSILPPKFLVAERTTIEAGRAAHFVYSLCGDETSGRKRRRRTATSPLAGWSIERRIACGESQELTPLPVKALPTPEAGKRCVALIDSIAPGDLSPGRCRFEVNILVPGEPGVRRELEFTVSPVALGSSHPSAS